LTTGGLTPVLCIGGETDVATIFDRVSARLLYELVRDLSIPGIIPMGRVVNVL